MNAPSGSTGTQFLAIGQAFGGGTDIWEEAGAMPIFHPAFGEDVPLRYDLQIDGQRYLDPVSPAAPVTIIHGCDDETVPIDHSRAYASTYSDDVRLVEVNAGHDLNDHLNLIWEYVHSFLLAVESSV